MKLVLATDLARSLGISRHTMKSWYRLRPELFMKRRGRYYVKLTAVAKLPGFDSISAELLPNERWVPLPEVARKKQVSRQAVWQWKNRYPGNFKRIGGVWYMNEAKQ